MLRTYVLSYPTQYTPGVQRVMIPGQSVTPDHPTLEHINTTQDALPTGDGNWGDEQLRAAFQAGMEERYKGDTIEVLLVSEWEARIQAVALAAKAQQDAAAATIDGVINTDKL